jgi:hypothetical protein
LGFPILPFFFGGGFVWYFWVGAMGAAGWGGERAHERRVFFAFWGFVAGRKLRAQQRALVVEGRLEISATILSSEGGCGDGGLGGESGACVA